MKREKYVEVCEAAAAGERKLVENIPLRYTGEVVGCMNGKLVVKAFGRRFDWSQRHCRSTDGMQNPLGPPSNI